MSQAPPAEDGSTWLSAFDARWPGMRRRAGGLLLAVLLELALLLLLLTLGRSGDAPRGRGDALTTVDLSPETPAEAPAPRPEQTAQPSPQTATAPADLPPRPSPLRPDAAPIPRPAITLPVPGPRPAPAPAPAPADPGKARAVIRDDMGGPMGPPNTGRSSSGDSEVVGSGPNGEPVYRARWQREPYDNELRGYLSTASGPGWALINCRTVPQYRVEDCVLVDEYPEGGGMGRAVLAAAWQFKVRPPQVRGQLQVGAWVRIRISYDLTRR